MHSFTVVSKGSTKEGSCILNITRKSEGVNREWKFFNYGAFME